MNTQSIATGFTDDGDYAELVPTWGDHIPLRERVLDRLSDVLIGVDDLLDMLRPIEGRTMGTAYEDLAVIYQRVDGLMKQLSD